MGLERRQNEDPEVNPLSSHAQSYRQYVGRFGHTTLFMVTPTDAPQRPVETARRNIPGRRAQAFDAKAASTISSKTESAGSITSVLGEWKVGCSAGGAKLLRCPLCHSTSHSQSTTNFSTATMLVYATGAGITAAAGTRLALQLILTVGFMCNIHDDPPLTFGGKRCCHFSLLHHQCIGMEQVACLLPSLGVVAVAHAPSSESNPNSPSPVTVSVGPFNTSYN